MRSTRRASEVEDDGATPPAHLVPVEDSPPAAAPPQRPFDAIRTRPVGPIVQMLLALAVYGGLALVVLNDPELLGDGGPTPVDGLLPEAVRVPLEILVIFGVSGVFELLLVAVSLVAFRFRLARDIFVAALVATGLVIALGLSTWSIERGPTSIVAIVVVALPYFRAVGKRRILYAAVPLLAGYVTLIDAAVIPFAAAVAVGLFAGNVVVLLFGVRAEIVNAYGVQLALADVGLDVADVVKFDEPSRLRPYLVTLRDGTKLFAKVRNAEDVDADWLSKTRRRLFRRWSQDEAAFGSAKQYVAHEAYMLDFAQRAGARTPAVVTSTAAPTGDCILVETYVSGVRLDQLPLDRLTDEVLEDVWRQVRDLHRNRILHGELRLDNIVLDPDGDAVVLDLGVADYGAADEKLAVDTAELLTSSAVRVGAARAVGAACAVMSRDAMHRALLVLIPQALTKHTRGVVRRLEDADFFESLREELADAIDADPSEKERLNRVEARSLVQVAGLGLVMYLLLPQLGNFGETVEAWQRADWRLLFAAAVAAALTYAMVALQLMGSVPGRLPFWWTTLSPLAAEFANRITPGGVGGMAVNASYLRKAGFTRTEAAISVTLCFVFGVLVNIPVLIVMLLFLSDTTSDQFQPPRISTELLLLIGAVVLGVGIVTVSLRRVRRTIGRQAREAGRALRVIFSRPKGALLLATGSTGLLAAYTVSFLCCVYAFGADVPIVAAVTIYLGAASIGQLVPTPGGVGGVEAVAIAGLTRAGVDGGTAVAIVLTFRMLTYWLPIVPSMLSYRVLQRAERI